MKKLLFYASAVAVLFSSCSKDATEDIAINKAGNEVFSVSLNTEEESTTRVTLSGSTFVWDVNDAIGVATTEAPKANIMVSTSIGGTAPKFSVSEEDYTRWLDDVATTANPLMVYFPYKPGTEFAADGKLTVNIPAKQRYAHESFYKNAIHAVGYAPEYTGADQQIALHVPHGFIQAKVVGWGDMKSITLSIKDKNGNDVNLTGNYEVDALPEYTEEDGYATDHKYITAEKSGETYGKEITVDLGFKPEDLLFSDPLLVNFVVPAGIKLSEATLTFTNDKGDTYDVKMDKEASDGKMNMRPSLRVTVSQNVQFGLDDKFLIWDDDQYTAEEKFLAYAYLAQVQTADSKPYDGVWDTVKSFVPNASSVYDVDALLVDTELDFSSYTKAWADAAKAELDNVLTYDAINEFWINVYDWYSKNGGAIESLAYNNIISDTNTTIKNLNVVGSGISAGAGLESLTIENVTVKAKGGNFAGLIAGHSDLAKVKDVVISTGNKVVAENVPQVGGIFGCLAAADAAIATAKAIAIEAKDCEIVGRLYGKVLSTIELTLKDKYDWDASVSSYPVIGYVDNHANVTADIAVSAELKNGGVVGKVYVAPVADDYASSVIVEGVSYWNGDIVWGAAPTMAVDADGVVTDPFTAEDLAAVLTTDAFSSTYFLTHDIDMQCDHVVWGADALDPMGVYPEFSLWTSLSGSRKIKLDGKNHTISNASVTGQGTGYVSLFGYEAELKDVKVANLIVNTSAAATNNIFAVAGLAYSGKAENVSVENVIVNVADKLSNTSAGVAAIFSVADIKEDIKNVTVKNCSIVSNKAVTAGIVAGVLNVSGKTSAIEGIIVEGTNSVKTAAGAMNKTKGLINTNYVAPKAYAYTAPFGIVNVTDAAFAASGTVTHTLTVSKSSYGSVFAAGYTFANASTAKKDVVLSKTAFSVADLENYDYAFMSNANVDNYFNNIAFVK
ncbi:MAG: hypothetical protein E7142_08410 [Rikenellaceae bacterium]|nr:hypothetical protein [Rikenellaceae bacterium]